MESIVAIVGRPNVGKSTLFNRLSKNNLAIVDSESGVTRDRHYSSSDWNGKKFTIIDTGGYVSGGDDKYEKEIDKQVVIALEECDKIIFVVDVNESNNSLDKEITKILHKTNKPVIIAINKVDKNSLINDSLQFYNLGFENLFAISAINGSGTGELLDELVNNFTIDNNEDNDEMPSFAVVGRPNAGKSSFINTIVGEERNIVKNEPGTTRDSIDTIYNKFDFKFKIIDTAGIRKKSKINSNLEFYSVVRSIKSIEKCDVCLLIIDATRGFDSQIKNIFWLAHRRNKAIIILVNKWDLVEKFNNTAKDFEELIKKEIQPFDDVNILFISCIKKQRIFKSLECAIEVFKTRSKKIKTSRLNNDLLPLIESYPPPSNKGKRIKIKYCSQLPGRYPQFVFFANLPQYIKDPYKRFIENNIRKIYNFTSVPVKIYFRKK
jgi:GTP-binding protein|tara:strand:- start:24948 stop:26252 length:1305 start_codon:yes stop_codon:yes gene_type:complete